MLFKNVTVLKLIDDVPTDADAIEVLLERHRFIAAQGLDSEKTGWVNPVDESEGTGLVRELSGAFIFCLKVETKILPASVVAEEVRERLDLRGMKRGKARAKDIQRITEEVRFEMLPKAFSRYKRVMGYIDLERQELIVGSATTAQVEDFTAMLRSSLGTLKLAALSPEEEPHLRMTAWMKSLSLPDRVSFGNEISLEDPTEGGKGNFKKQDLSSDEIKKCLELGKNVQRLALKWNDYLSFTIDGSLVIRKIDALEMFDKDMAGDDEDEDFATFDTDFFLTVNGLRQLLPELFSWFGVGVGSDEVECNDYSVVDDGPALMTREDLAHQRSLMANAEEYDSDDSDGDDEDSIHADDTEGDED